MADAHYALTVNATNVSSSAFYQLDPTSNLSILQGGFSCYATELSATSVAIYPQLAQLWFPAASVISGGVTILTSAPKVTGTFQVSPAINSPVAVTLYGTGGKVLGSVTLVPGQTSVPFDWTVSLQEGMSQDEARTALSETVKQQH